jgi:hypothetical protein
MTQRIAWLNQPEKPAGQSGKVVHLKKAALEKPGLQLGPPTSSTGLVRLSLLAIMARCSFDVFQCHRYQRGHVPHTPLR